MSIHFAQAAFASYAVLIAMFFDVRERRIPNWLVADTLIVSLVMQIQFDSPLSWLTGMSIGFAMFIPGYLARQLGAGDVKLMAAAGSFFGIESFHVGLIAYVIGGVYALGWMVWQKNRGEWLKYLKFRLTTLAVVAVSKTGSPILRDEGLSQGRPKAATVPFSVPIGLATMVGLWMYR